MSWNSKRQSKYFFSVLFFLLIIGFLLLKPIVFKEPTCFDGKKNGDETGIDCGGNCQLFCKEEAKPLSVKWAKAFKVIDGRYNVAAYIVNQNTEASINKIPYVFKLYDSNNRFIVERFGETYIPSGKSSVVFESGLMTGGNREPAFVFFEFLSQPVWYRVPSFTKDVSLVVFEDPVFMDQDSVPKMTVNIVNKSFYTVKDVDVYAVLYDESGNVSAVSKTVLSELGRNSTVPASFSWFLPIKDAIVRKEIVINFNPFFGVSNVQNSR